MDVYCRDTPFILICLFHIDIDRNILCLYILFVSILLFTCHTLIFYLYLYNVYICARTQARGTKRMAKTNKVLKTKPVKTDTQRV